METLAYLYSVEETEISAVETFFDNFNNNDPVVLFGTATDGSHELMEDEIIELETSVVWMMP
ncbi:hypothetical protein H6G89_15880 [Oscillatoria sp. FACHB-1407]|uniref:hypothetical protein n=1 Tax=Oscillatoria sp. FACHB-1407 TaxID=2692847 RepID=UPI001682B8C3|nr:hypothetical protein [Oscillatoria sp. FACHB-1407]MBD2462525.1 hypothetical protein [Oscillatoria sp. FACHB-1407]